MNSYDHYEFIPKNKLEVKVKRIFNPFGFDSGAHRKVGHIANMIIQGIFEYSSEEIEILEAPPDFGITAVGNETVKHLNAKYTAYMLLRKLGASETRIECEDWMDVYSPTLNIRVECGHTDPSRLVKSFHRNNPVKEFWIFQYASRNHPPMLYKFTLREDGIEKLHRYMELRSESELNELIETREVDWR